MAGSSRKGDDDGPLSVDGSAPAEATGAEIMRLTLYADAQARKVAQLETTVLQLQTALDARVVIERAIGILAERLDLEIHDAFELLRSASRDSRREVRALAEELLESRGRTPAEIIDARSRHEPS